MSARSWRRLRQAVQFASLLLYLALFVYTTGQRPYRLWADLYTRLDPLAMLGATLAGRALVGGLVLAVAVLLLTAVFGRVWCGWLCPLGTLLEWLGPRRARGKRPPEGWRAGKYLLLFAILLAALLANQTLLVLDPITILNRTLSTAVWPGLRFGLTQGEAFLYRFRLLWGALDAFHAFVLVPLFQEVQPVFGLAPWIALLFVGLVALNWWARRFWCRYLCPLGGLLGLLSRLALVRREVVGGCVNCGRCAGSCPTDTVNPQKDYRSDPAECIVCYDCLVDCGREAAAFRWRVRSWRPAARQGYDPTRRQVLAALAASAAGVARAGVEPITKRQPATMVRPPGALLTDFSSLCIRCAVCIRACPTQGLQPSLLEGGLQNVLTPRLVPRLGFCNYGCNACGQVCPSGAIPRLPLEEKQRTPIGLAAVDRDRCLPWAYGIPCIVCEEACPVPDKAIKLEEIEVVNARGEAVLLQQPRVIRELCIGCGVCEYKCPQGGEAAIRVYAATEVGLPPG